MALQGLYAHECTCVVLYTLLHADCSICVLLVVPPKTSTEGSVMATDIEFDKFTLQLSPSLFNDTHGPVVSYAILLTSDPGMIVKIYVLNFFLHWFEFYVLSSLYIMFLFISSYMCYFPNKGH